MGISQLMYVPVRTKEEIGKYDIPNNSNIQIHYSFVLKMYHRLLFNKKINKVYFDVINKVDPKEYDLIHAHFLFSDGGVALELYKKYQIPYIVSVRNTDVNYFFKYYKHLKRYGNEILNKAEKVIFLTPSYRDVVENKYVYHPLRKSFKNKCIIVPNGLKDFWFSGDQKKLLKNCSESIKLLYVGDFTPNKNVENIIDTARKIRNEGIAVSLTLVGGGGKGNEKTLKKITSTDDLPIKFLGRVSDREKLRQIYQEHDIFIMPSYRETFGIVYIEAISQGVPIIYTEKQGVDGYFSEDKRPGLAVNPNNVDEIAEAIKVVWGALDKYSANALKASDQFNLNLVVDKLFKIYKSNVHE
jgi:L-malate glycosyltransferase